MSGAERPIVERIQEALAQVPAEDATVAEVCRRARISRACLYRSHPEALAAIRQIRRSAHLKSPHAAMVKRLRAELNRANTLSQHLSALLDHYAGAYRESQEILHQRERELAELRRSGGSLPTALRR